MTKRQWIRAGFILAGALILNGCGRQSADRPAAARTSVASQTTKMLAREADLLLSPMRDSR